MSLYFSITLNTFLILLRNNEYLKVSFESSSILILILSRKIHLKSNNL